MDQSLAIMHAGPERKWEELRGSGEVGKRKEGKHDYARGKSKDAELPAVLTIPGKKKK